MFCEGKTNISEIQGQVTEIWSPIPGYSPKYEVSSLGKVRNRRTGRILKPNVKHGYSTVMIPDVLGIQHIVYVHRLVALSFIPNPKHYPQINHIDSNRGNNVVSNLEWCTAQQNIAHAVKHGRFGAKRFFTKEYVAYIRKNYNETIRMNSKKTLEIDSRSMPEIWASLTQLQKETVTYALQQKGCAATRQTIWNWGKGNCQPYHPFIKKVIADTLTKVIGSRVLPHTLFPGK